MLVLIRFINRMYALGYSQASISSVFIGLEGNLLDVDVRQLAEQLDINSLTLGEVSGFKRTIRANWRHALQIAEATRGE